MFQACVSIYACIVYVFMNGGANIYTRSMCQNPYKWANMFNFSWDRRGLKLSRLPPLRRSQLPCFTDDGRPYGQRRYEQFFTVPFLNRRWKLIGDFRNVFKLMDYFLWENPV